MDVQAVTNSASTTLPKPAAGSGTAAVSSDFETFLKMLTAQMRNQDPLNPVDSSDYAVQLATFSSVEQQVLTNELLSGMAAQLSGGLKAVAGWIGMQAQVPVHGHFTGAPLEISYTPAPGGDRQVLVVHDAQGAEVSRLVVPQGRTEMLWAGVGQKGQMLPEGLYSFAVENYAGDTLLGVDSAHVFSRVSEVRIEKGEPVLILDGGARVSPDEVTALHSSVT